MQLALTPDGRWEFATAALIVGGDESGTMTCAELLADRAQTIGAEWVLTVLYGNHGVSRANPVARGD